MLYHIYQNLWRCMRVSLFCVSALLFVECNISVSIRVRHPCAPGGVGGREAGANHSVLQYMGPDVFYCQTYVNCCSRELCSTLYMWHDDVIKWKHFQRHGPLCGEFTGHLWITHIKAGDAELWYFLWSAPGQTDEQTIETLVIRDTIALIMTSM